VGIEHEATRKARVPGSEGRVGEVLAGKYRLEELLGAGAMGTVYRAVNQLVGRSVAIKLLKPEHAENAIVVERFMREARAANLVRHKNVVDVIDIDKDLDGHPFIVQELLRGEDLSRYVARRGGKLPLEEVVDLMCPVIEAVAEAHAKGVVHRDIKPENVFLAKDGRDIVPKLLDFGISKIRATDLRATEIGVTMGTPAYMAPEQVQGARDADPKSDVWALGIMLFELLAGRLPFDEVDAPALFVAIATKDAPALLEIDKTIPPSVSKLVARCLRRIPQDRYPSASELARDLSLVIDGQELEPTGKISIPPSLRVPDLGFVPKIPIARAPKVAPREEEVSPDRRRVRSAISQPPDLSLSGDTAPSAGVRVEKEQEDLPPPPSLEAPRVSKPKPEPPRRLTAEAALPGVVMAPVTAHVKPAPRREDWGLARGKEKPDGPDMSLIIGMAVVGVVLIGVVGALMQLAHRPEGWPIVSFLGAPPSLATPLQIFFGVAAVAIGATYARRGVRHWRGDLAGGPPSAIIGALVAAGAFFSAVELISAAW
jgi:serine/threonine protein kinase